MTKENAVAPMTNEEIAAQARELLGRKLSVDEVAATKGVLAVAIEAVSAIRRIEGELGLIEPAFVPTPCDRREGADD